MYEEKCPFTRDYNQIRSTLENIDDYDKTWIENALHGVNSIVLNEWGNGTPCEIILITDGGSGLGATSLKSSLATANQRTSQNPFPLPFSFPAKLHVVVIAPPNSPTLIKSQPLFQRLIVMGSCDGSLSILPPDSALNESTVSAMFQKLAEDIYTSFKGTLKCGHLESRIMLSPPPMPYTKITDFDYKTYKISDEIEVCGFIALNDVGSPAAISRHLIIPPPPVPPQTSSPSSSTSSVSSSNPPTSEPMDEDSPDHKVISLPIIDEGKQPSFCVLLHGALKVENMAALVCLAEPDWYGFVYSWADSKKKSNLMLTILTPGTDSVPWLGDLSMLSVVGERNHEDDDDVVLTSSCGNALSSFPVRPAEKRSYSQNSVVWIKHAGLQSDIQKILRHARKMPEKTQQFYKELNRLRKAAISLGFLDLLSCLALIFDQECLQLPNGAHPDCAIQLQHAAECLRKTQDIKFNIHPLRTNYNS